MLYVRKALPVVGGKGMSTAENKILISSSLYKLDKGRIQQEKAVHLHTNAKLLRTLRNGDFVQSELWTTATIRASVLS